MHGRPLLIVVIAWNRPESLRRLLRSLEQADYGAAPSSMELWFALDGAENATVDTAIDDVIDAMRWPYGDTLVRRRARRAGLRDNVLGSWTGDEGRAAVMLEDDIEVSELWWHWTQAALDQYTALPSVVGVSLFTPDDLNEAFDNGSGGSVGPDGRTTRSCHWQADHLKRGGGGGGSDGASERAGVSAVLFGQPCSWGAVYLPEAWRSFRRRALELRAARMPPDLPCPPDTPKERLTGPRACRVTANRWGRSSWKRLMMYHMVEQGLVMAYPNLPSRASFSTNHVEPGQHLAGNALVGQRMRHKVPLVDRALCSRLRIGCDAYPGPRHTPSEAPPFALPTANQIRAYDFYCRQQPEGEAAFVALSATGQAVREKAKPLEPAEALPPDDDDGTEYVVRSKPPDARVEL